MFAGLGYIVGESSNALYAPNQSIELLIIGVGAAIVLVVAAVVLDKRINK